MKNDDNQKEFVNDFEPEYNPEEIKQTKRFLKNICLIAFLIAALLWLNDTHYKYEHSGYPISFAKYLTNFYWCQEPASTDFSPTSDFNIIEY